MECWSNGEFVEIVPELIAKASISCAPAAVLVPPASNFTARLRKSKSRVHKSASRVSEFSVQVRLVGNLHSPIAKIAAPAQARRPSSVRPPRWKPPPAPPAPARASGIAPRRTDTPAASSRTAGAPKSTSQRKARAAAVGSLPWKSLSDSPATPTAKPPEQGTTSLRNKPRGLIRGCRLSRPNPRELPSAKAAAARGQLGALAPPAADRSLRNAPTSPSSGSQS